MCIFLIIFEQSTSYATGWFLSVGPGTFKYLPWSLLQKTCRLYPNIGKALSLSS